MTTTSLWGRLDVELPGLPYCKEELDKQAQSTTVWASHFHTPVAVSEWEDFDACIAAESANEMYQSSGINLKETMSLVKARKVEEEEHVTVNTSLYLECLSEVTAIEFSTTAKYTLSNPDLIARRKRARVITSEWTMTPKEPGVKDREKERKKLVQELSASVLFTVETKPVWKFRFLLGGDSTDSMIKLWGVPAGYTAEDLLNERALPKNWSNEQKKIFHLIRQLYGQMTSSQRRYGIMHIYECWWFCCRTPQGELKISRPFQRQSTSPSVLQAIVTLAGFDDFILEEVTVHPASAQKADRRLADQRKRELKPATTTAASNAKIARGSNTGGGRGGKDASNAKNKSADLAASVCLWDCTLVDVTDTVQLLSTRKDPTILIKLQRNPRVQHVADEMQREASIYKALSKKEDMKDVVPSFHGYSTHLGVSLLCVGMEGSDFEDIGLANLSQELKVSAVESLQQLSAAGLLHNDIALRNIVQSKDDPQCAKIIDFGHAAFSNDKVLLQEQVEFLERILGLRTTQKRPDFGHFVNESKKRRTFLGCLGIQVNEP